MASIEVIDAASRFDLAAGPAVNTALHEGLHSCLPPHIVKERLSGLSPLLFPDEVCEAVGVDTVEAAFGEGLLGPADVIQSVLCNSHLFGEGDGKEQPASLGERPNGGNIISTARVEGETEQQIAEQHTTDDTFTMSSRFDKAFFDSTAVTRVCFIIAAVARVLFNWIPSIPFSIEFAVFYSLLLAVCANCCAIKKCLRSTLAMVITNGILHLLIILSSHVFPLPFAFSSSHLIQLCAIAIMVTSYTEQYFFRLLSQILALSLVLLNGYMSFSADKDDDVVMAECPIEERSLSSGTALTVILCLVVSGFTSEAVKYSTRKSYSGR